MIDIKRIKADKEKIEKALSKRMGECSLDEIVRLDAEKMKLQQALEKFAYLQNIKRYEGKIGKIKGATIDNIKIMDLINYLQNEKISDKLRNIGYSLNDNEWLQKLKSRMQILHNIAQGFEKKAQISPAISEFILGKLNETSKNYEELNELEEYDDSRKNTL